MREFVEERNEEALCMDGFDDCIIGVCYRINQPPITAYSLKKVIEKMVTEEGMSYEEAYEFYEYNQLGSWLGENTPCFLELEEDE